MLSWKAIIIGFFVQISVSISIGAIVGFTYRMFLLFSGVPQSQITGIIAQSSFVNGMGIFVEISATILGGYIAVLNCETYSSEACFSCRDFA